MRLITPEKLLEILRESGVTKSSTILEDSPDILDMSKFNPDKHEVAIEGMIDLEELARRINQYCSQPGIHSKTKVRSGTA